MRKSVLFIIAAVFILSAAGTGHAQTDDPVIKAREKRQQERIAKGIESGQLTPKEAAKLEKQQAKIRNDERKMKADGKLTKQERQQLKKEENKASRNIYNKKHNQKKAQ